MTMASVMMVKRLSNRSAVTSATPRELCLCPLRVWLGVIFLSSLHAHVSRVDHYGSPFNLVRTSVEGIPESIGRVLHGGSSPHERNHDRTNHGVVITGGSADDLEGGAIEIVRGRGGSAIDQ